MGHVVDNAQSDKYTTYLDNNTIYTNETGEFVMGRECPDKAKCKYRRTDGLGLIATSLDQCGKKVPAEIHSIALFPGDGNTAIEEWGDLFANYVINNFDDSPAGRAKYDWIHYQLFGG